MPNALRRNLIRWLPGLLLLLAPACTSHIPSIYLKSAELAMDLHRPAYGISDLVVSKDGTLLLTGDTGGRGGFAKASANDVGLGTLRLWDLVHGRLLRAIPVKSVQLIYSVALSPDNRYAVAVGTPSGRNSGLTVWELASGREVERLPPLRGEIFSVAFSPDGRYLLATNLTSALVFDFASGQLVNRFDTGYKSSAFPMYNTLPRRLVAAFLPDSKTVLLGGTDAALALWDVASGQKIRDFVGHERGKQGGISGIAISGDGKYAFTCAVSDSTARLWEIATGKELRQFPDLSVFILGAWGTSLSPDAKQGFIIALPLGLWDTASGKLATPLQLQNSSEMYIIQEKPGSAAFNPNGRTLLLAANDAAVRIFDTASGRELAMLVGFDNGEWIITTSEGYYNASEHGAENLTVKLGGQDYTVERFYDVFYRPDIVSATLKGEDTSGLVNLTMQDAVQNPPPLMEISRVPADSAATEAEVCYRVKSSGGGIGEVRVFHNGKLVKSDGYYRELARTEKSTPPGLAMDSGAIYANLRGVTVKGKTAQAPSSAADKGELLEECQWLRPVAGENEVSVAAFNRTNTVQGYLKTARFRSTLPLTDPKLHILAIGIDRYRNEEVSLKYAAKDAADIEAELRRQSATLFRPENIRVRLLTDREAGKREILAAIAELARTIRPEDSFIFFAAGHGVMLQNQYYLLTSDFAGQVDGATTLSSNEIVEASKQIPALSQLLIFDTCHAGGMDAIVGGLYDARMSVLAKKMGLHIYASASSKEEAQDGYRGNGLFTYTLLDGLKNPAADLNRDRSVSLVELGNYAREATSAISRQNRREQTPLIINFGKDNPLYKLP